jgi:hypothetical protein
MHRGEIVKPFSDLGLAVASAWDRAGRTEAVFPRIAVELLEASRVLHDVDPDCIVDWFATTGETLDQDKWEFGQPGINLYHDRDFYIQVLFWVDATTSIHEHGFGGAFGVLSGSSVHSSYSFQAEDRDCSALLLGDLKFVSAELLTQGDVRPIEMGGNPHALFHLDRPSVSVVVRTRAGRQGPQYEFHKPGIGVDPLYNPDMDRTRLRLLQTLARIDSPTFWPTATKILRSADLWMTYQLLPVLSMRKQESEAWSLAQEEIGARHGLQTLQKMLRSMVASEVEREVVHLRRLVHEPSHRFFLALLLNLPGRNQIYKLIGERFPSADPGSLALRWLGEIFRESRMGLRFTPSTLQMLRLMMHGASNAEVKAALGRGMTSANDDRVDKVWERLQNLVLLQPLLRP